VKLPAQVPFNDPVTVCVSCLRASCVLGRFVCALRKAGLAETAAAPLADVRTAAKESPGYWKPQRPEQDNDIPIDVEEMHRLIGFIRTLPNAERPMMAGYLELELGIDPEQVAEAMAAEWPEEAVSK